MKTKRFCKSTVSLILALIMLVSMCSVALTSVSAAVTDVAETGATKVYFKGGFNNWGTNYEFATSGTNNVLEVTVTIATSGTYGFKVDDNSAWYGMNDTTVTNTTGGSWYNMYTNTSDAQWKVDAGTYLVKWNTSDKKLWIEKTNGGSGGGETGDTTEEFPYSVPSDDASTVYVVASNGWTNVNCHSWNKDNTSNTTAWPGEAMELQTKTFNGKAIYKITLENNRNMVIFNNGSEQTGDITFVPCNYYDLASGQWTPMNTTGTVVNPFEPTEITHIAFRDDADDSVDNNYDTRLFVSFDDGSKQAMTKGVDPMSGHDLWFIEKPTTVTTVKFYGAKATDKKCASPVYTWDAGTYPADSTGLYRAKSTSSGEWGGSTHPYAIPDINDINNKSFGIWVDTVADGASTDGHTDHGAHDAVVTRKISSSEFHLYLPSSTPASPKVYTSFYDLKIDGTDVESGDTFNFGTDLYNEYSISYVQTEYDDASNPKSATLKVYRTKDVATVLLTTDYELYTELALSMSAEYKDYKEIKTAGSYHMYDEEGKRVNTEGKYDEEKEEYKGAGIKQVKGRGNSTFEASMKLYGKYAYNITFNDTVELIEGATKSKKWCFLANNVDHSLMRNSFVYSLADDIGLKYAPKTRLVNLYDNGNYMGAYTITEKVEYGEKTLMNDLVNLDDEHEGWYEDYNASIGNADFGDYDEEAIKAVGTADAPINYTAASGGSFKYRYWTSDVDGFEYEHAENDEDPDYYKKEFNFLLEHELSDRYKDEASWFKSERTGQYVVVKYPEFATQKEMKWAMDMYDKLEKAAYTTKTLDAIDDAADVDSFAKMYLIQELGLNLDACATSYYIHNDRFTNKLVASPVWDYDWSFGSYFKTKITVNNGKSSSLDNPKQMYVKNKDINNGIDSGWSNKRNLQAQLTQTTGFWERCQFLWTNSVYGAIDVYVDTDKTGSDSGVIFEDWKEKFESALDMNFARWGGYACNGNVEAPDQNNSWGTKVTNKYLLNSYNFSTGSQNTTGAADDWGNTIDYLNDWIAVRSAYMNDNGLKSIYKLKNLVVDETRVENTVTINADFFASVNDSEIISENDAAGNKYKRFKVFVNGVEQVDNYHVTDTGLCTVEIPEGETIEVVVRGYLSGGPSIYYIDSEVYEYTYEEVNKYTFDISYTATQLDGIEYYEIKPNATVTDKDGNPVPEANLEWRLTVDDAEYDFISFSESMKVMLWMEDTNIKIDVRVKDDDDNPDNNPSGSTTGTISGVHIPEYTIQDGTVTFAEEDGKITANVSGKILRDGVEMTEEQLDTYGFYQDIYVNGEDTNERQSPFGSFTFDAVKGENTFSVDVFNGAGMFIDTISGTYEYDGVADGTPVTMTIMFKSSSSYRYIPSISYGEVSPTAMTQDEYLGTNEKQTQKYYWYKAEVQAYAGTPITLTFNNAYQMNAKVTIDDPSAKTYYIGVDNMNSGLVAEILPDGSDYDSEFKRNFFQSAANMVNTEATAGEVAYSVLGGTRYKAGDADGDGEITVVDATVMQMALAEKVELSSISSALSDYNVDGNKSITDATLVQTYLVN